MKVNDLQPGKHFELNGVKWLKVQPIPKAATPTSKEDTIIAVCLNGWGLLYEKSGGKECRVLNPVFI